MTATGSERSYFPPISKRAIILSTDQQAKRGTVIGKRSRKEKAVAVCNVATTARSRTGGRRAQSRYLARGFAMQRVRAPLPPPPPPPVGAAAPAGARAVLNHRAVGGAIRARVTCRIESARIYE
eukprot:IDg5369t1